MVDVWGSLMPEHGGVVRSALAMLAMVPADAFAKAVEGIERETAIGPLMNPSAYLDGARFRNADEYVRILKATAALRKVLPDIDGEG